MKTKFYLTALALPAVFAACQSDDLEIANQDTALNSRIELQNVTFVTGGVNSRLVQGDNDGNGVTDFNELLFQTNDGMGACLIDVLSDAGASDPVKRYNLTTNYVQSNYRYGYADGIWNSQANLVEGNYMFYMPYNASAQGRTAIVANLPAEQTLALDANGEYSTFADVVAKSVENGYPLVAGYKFLKAGDSNTQLSLTLQPIYAYPKFTLSNITGKDIVITSIEITRGGDDFELVKPFKFANAAGTAYAEANQSDDSFVDCFFDAASSNGGQNGDWSVAKMDNTVAKSTGNILGAVAANGSNVITIDVDSYTLKADEDFSFYAVIPAGEYSNLTVKIGSTEGTSAKFVYPACHLNPGKRYPVAEYTEAGTIATKGAILTGIIAGLEVDNSVAVSDNNSLLRALASFTPTAAASSIDIRMTNQDVALTSAMIGVLNNKTWGTAGIVNFVSDVVIDNAGDWMTALPENMTINFKKNVTIKGENNTVVINGSKVNFAEGTKLTIASSAAATVYGEKELLAVENNGVMNVENKLSVKSVANKGTMNLSANLKTTDSADNTNSIVVKADAEVTGALNNGNSSQVAASLTVNASKTLTARQLNNMKGASITNNGVITSEDLVNNGTIKNGASNNVNAVITAEKGTNISTIDNYAGLKIKFNIGAINMKSFMASAEVNDRGTSWGTIENTVGAAVTAASADQYIWKTVEEETATLPTNLEGATYNSIKYVGTTVSANGVNALSQISFEGGALNVTGELSNMPKLNVSGEVTINLTAGLAAVDGAVVSVEEGALLNIVGNGKSFGYTTINIAKNATVNSNATISGNVNKADANTSIYNQAN